MNLPQRALPAGRDVSKQLVLVQRLGSRIQRLVVMIVSGICAPVVRRAMVVLDQCYHLGFPGKSQLRHLRPCLHTCCDRP